MRVTAVILAVFLTACGGTSSRSESAASGTQPHKLRVSVEIPGLGRPVSARATVSMPTRWRVVKATATRLRLRAGNEVCSYEVNATIDVVHVDAANAADAARAVVPLADGRLLEAGHRGSAAWRVVKLRGNGTQVRLDAVRTQPLRYISSQAKQPTWLVTRFTAASDPGDECHSGTYRDTLGPALGDALATVRARV